MILLGDCIEAMCEMDEASVDAIVTDPPYLLGFMGKAFDSQHRGFRRAENPNDVGRDDVFGRTSATSPEYVGEAHAMQQWHQAWATEALRVLKPGGHLLAFGGTRTYHRLACAVEDAGFEMRDSLIWLYGSGFPKSLDVSKAIDKAAGAERTEVLGSKLGRPGMAKDGSNQRSGFDDAFGGEASGVMDTDITAPATPEAQQWQGWGTALKPAHEPIVVARKPLIGTVAQNVLEHGTGALNIDGTRIGQGGHLRWSEPRDMGYHGGTDNGSVPAEESPSGRWPANCVLSHLPECERVGTRRVSKAGGNGEASLTREGGWPGDTGERPSHYDPDGTEQVEAWRCAEGCPVAELDRQSGELQAGAHPARKNITIGDGNIYGSGKPQERPERIDLDTGGASRFFYTAKASRAERNAGLDGFEERRKKVAVIQTPGVANDGDWEDGKQLSAAAANHHPTVKPIDLMRWLVRLVTPPGGLICDPFCGSGTTGIAATLEGFSFIGIEREAEYAEIARARIAWWEAHPEGMELVKRLNAEAERKAVTDAGQLELL